ncbi:MAG: carbon storage regulator CsrA [Oscillospiraceae bacterium]|nr:carbon storage regulator CsrA [Oscillospiraceae bacterium]
MLIISRKRNEGIIINENIELTVIDIQGDKVRIGLDAPTSVKIVRKELLETEKLNKEAAQIQSKPDVKKLKDILNNKNK